MTDEFARGKTLGTEDLLGKVELDKLKQPQPENQTDGSTRLPGFDFKVSEGVDSKTEPLPDPGKSEPRSDPFENKLEPELTSATDACPRGCLTPSFKLPKADLRQCSSCSVVFKVVPKVQEG